MKNLSKRNNTLLAIAVLVVVILAGILTVQPPLVGQLLGASTLTITPANPTVNLGSSVRLSVSSSFGVCTWTSNSSNVSVGSAGNSVIANGVAVGAAQISVKCPTSVSPAVTTVTVAYPSVWINATSGTIPVDANSAANTSTGEPCTWTTQDALPFTVGGASTTAPQTSAAVTFTGTRIGDYALSISCVGGRHHTRSIKVCSSTATDVNYRCPKRQ